MPKLNAFDSRLGLAPNLNAAGKWLALVNAQFFRKTYANLGLLIVRLYSFSAGMYGRLIRRNS